ncbi:MAG: class I SAM-dependent methyltransferase [Candidatus Pacearchaeota archaeon]
MKIEQINCCRVCGNKNLISLLDLGSHSLSGVFPGENEPDPISVPLELVKCDEKKVSHYCGLVQLRHTPPLEEMYGSNYGYRSGLNQTMTNHLKDIVSDILKKVTLSPGEIVLDIGSNDSTLLGFYPAYVKKIGIDPSAELFRKYYPPDIYLVADFFNIDNFKSVVGNKKKAKVITSIAMFYDLPKPIEFVKQIAQILSQDGIWVSEQSYMPFMIERNSFDTICHEHLEYYGLRQICWILDKANLKLLDVFFNDINGGSFKFLATHKNSKYESNLTRINTLLQEEKAKGYHTLKPYLDFKERIDSIGRQITNFLNFCVNQQKTIHGYGASTKGNTLLQYYKIDNKLLQAISDRNPDKWGKFTPKTRIPIISEADSRKSKPDYYFVLPWFFKKEFLDREKEFLNSGGKFVFPLPYFEVVNKTGTEMGGVL